MANPTSNFNWQMPTASDLVTDLPADFEVFGQAVDTSLADLKGGTTGQVLAKNSNTDMDFVWSAVATTFVGCRVYANADKTISNSTVTVDDFAAEDFDTNSFHDNVTNNSRITIPTGKSGKYLVQTCSAYASNGTGTRQSYIYKNGSNILYFEGATGIGNRSDNNSVVLDLAAGDYLQFYTHQNSGGNLTLFGNGSFGSTTTSFGVTYLGA
jgi:hypothetical protein